MRFGKTIRYLIALCLLPGASLAAVEESFPAVTTAARSPFAPDIPTVAESGLPGYDFSYWWGIFVPVRTPPALAARLNRDIVTVVESPQTRAKFEAYGVTPLGSSLASFAVEVQKEARIWNDVARKSGITPQ